MRSAISVFWSQSFVDAGFAKPARTTTIAIKPTTVASNSGKKEISCQQNRFKLGRGRTVKRAKWIVLTRCLIVSHHASVEHQNSDRRLPRKEFQEDSPLMSLHCYAHHLLLVSLISYTGAQDSVAKSDQRLNISI